MNNISELLFDVKKVGITGHIRPDGDCVGSCMGLYNYILENYPEIECDVYLEQPGKEFAYIYNFDKIKNVPEDKEYDLFFVLDSSDVDRIAPFMTCFQNAKRTCVIDHHISNNNFCDVNIVHGQDSSACEALYRYLDNSKISKNVAECLYTGLIHDTGVFKYSSTSKYTMEFAGSLIEKGINIQAIIDESFYKKTFEQNKILGLALLKSQLIMGGKVIYSVIEKEEREKYNLTTSELGGVIEQLRLTDGVEVAIFMYGTDEGEYKVSLRAKEYVDVSKISVKFGGGGHVKAAGCSFKENIDGILEKLCAEISIQLNK